MKKIKFFFWVFCFLGLIFNPAIADKKDPIELLQPFPGQPTSITIDTNDGAIQIASKYFKMIFIFGSGLVVIFAVLMIIIGGYQIMFQGASAGQIDAGKQRITQALLGLVLNFLAGLILHTINPEFFKF